MKKRRKEKKVYADNNASYDLSQSSAYDAPILFIYKRVKRNTIHNGTRSRIVDIPQQRGGDVLSRVYSSYVSMGLSLSFSLTCIHRAYMMDTYTFIYINISVSVAPYSLLDERNSLMLRGSPGIRYMAHNAKKERERERGDSRWRRGHELAPDRFITSALLFIMRVI